MSIVVTSQEQLDKIPLDTDEQIIIKFGTPYNRAVVRNRYKYHVEARENSSVEARENSSVVARENSSVVAWENSSVDGSGNTQIVDRTRTHKIKTSANSRIVYMPKSIHEFMDFYGIKHTKKKATFYKAVHKVDGKYVSDHDNDFEYVISKIKKNDDINTNVNDDCGSGIHISHLAWAVDYGRNWKDLAIIEVEAVIDDIVMPVDTNGKVRVQQVKVLREVPLSECGLLGKILDKQRSKQDESDN